MIGLGRYNLLLKLGQGGMGAVYLARQKTLRRFCAVKVISPELAQNRETAERFLREARATAALSHPNLVGIFDCDQFESQYFIAMEYVEGMSLGEILRKHGPLPIPLALFWLNQAAVGMEYVHGKNIIHRDIKPDNMIIDGSGVLKIMDLGLAKDHIESDQSMTMTGTVMGSPHYMSPEQINDSKTVDHRTDLYSLGISFYQMATGHVPFRQTSAAAVCVAHLQEPIPSVALPDTDLTQALDALILKMADKDKDARFQSASEWIAALQPWVANYPMDEPAQEFFNKLGFDQRKVESLLEKEGIPLAEIDADIASGTPQREPSPSQVAPPMPSQIPVTMATTPTPPTEEPTSSWMPFFKWLGIGFAALVLLIGGARFAAKHKRPPTPQTASAPAEGKTSPPRPTPTESNAAHDQPAVKQGGLLAKTQPNGALVIFRLESKPGTATFEKVPVGKYPVKASLSGYRDAAQDVEIVDGKFTEVMLKLEKITGTTVIESVPSGAEVIIDGRLLGKTPLKLEDADGKTARCQLHLEGYQEAFLDLTFRESGETLPPVKLAAIPKPPSHDMAAQDSRNSPPRPYSPSGGGEPGTMGGQPPMGQQPMGQGPQGQQTEGSPGRGGLDEMATGMMMMKQTLEKSRTASDEQWSREKEHFLKIASERMKERGKTEFAVKKASEDLNAVLEQARGMSESDFMAQKEKLYMKMMGIMMSVMRDGPPPGGQDGPGWGRGAGKGGGGGGGSGERKRWK